MGWNGSSPSSVAQKASKEKKSASLFYIAVPSLIVAALIGLVVYFMTNEEEEVESASLSHSRAISEATSRLKQRKPSTDEEPAETDKAKTSERKPLYTGLLSWRKKRHAVITNHHEEVEGPKPIYQNVTEKIMLGMFGKELGDMPLPLPNIPDSERENLVGILISKNPITDSDLETTALAKDVLQQAKDAMIKYIRDEGGDPDDFFRYYHGQLVDAFYKRQEAIGAIEKMIEDKEDISLIRKFRDRVNALLGEQGIKPVQIMEDDEEETQNDGEVAND